MAELGDPVSCFGKQTCRIEVAGYGHPFLFKDSWRTPTIEESYLPPHPEARINPTPSTISLQIWFLGSDLDLSQNCRQHRNFITFIFSVCSIDFQFFAHLGILFCFVIFLVIFVFVLSYIVSLVYFSFFHDIHFFFLFVFF